MTEGYWPITGSRYQINRQYSVSIAIDNGIATVSVYLTSWSEHQNLPGGVSVTQKTKELIGKFTMEVDNDGLPSKEVLDSARYLIKLYKANPSANSVVAITAGMSELDVRQAFKVATGRTAIEDMFIGLPQAEERQMVKNKLDKLLEKAGMIGVKNDVDFTWFYTLSGMDKVYEKLLSTLCDKRLSFSNNSTYLYLMGADGLYHPWTNTIYYDTNTKDDTFIHELWHAYHDINLGNPLSLRDEEGVGGTINCFLLLYSQKIYGTYCGILESIRDGDDEKLEHFVTSWNDELMKDKEKQK